MVTTRKLSVSIEKDLQSRDFRRAFLMEAIQSMVEGDLQTGKVVLREYVNGTIGFVGLGEALGKSPKSLMRMLGSQGNPNARNLFEIITHLLKVEGGHVKIEFVRAASTVAA